MTIYRGVIANYSFVTPKEFLKMSMEEIALLEAILVDTKKKMDNKIKS